MNNALSVEQRAEAALLAAWHSLKITLLAVICALLIGAQSAGAIDSPQHLLLYVKVNWFTETITVIIAALVRAGVAAKKGTTTP